MIIVILIISFLTFLLMNIAPGDPAERKLSSQGIPISEETLNQARAEMGLDKPVIVRYGNWLKSLAHGDLGISYKDGNSVASKLADAIPVTLALALSSLALSLIISLPLAMITAYKRNSVLDHIVRVLSFIGSSIPNFLISIVLMYLFCVKLRILPVVANASLQGIILPCLALSIPITGRLLRQFRAEISSELEKDYVTGARIRGLSMRTILFKDVLHNSLIPIITIVALTIGTLLAGSVVIETIFRWPGLGKLLMDAIKNRDYPVIQGFVLLITVVYSVINLITDILYKYIDPRTKA